MGNGNCVSEKVFLAFWGTMSHDGYTLIETVEDPMLIGYARTSTVEQGASFDAQHAQLRAAGCEKIFAEQVSAVSPEREELEAALEFVREGDVLVSPSSTGLLAVFRTFAKSANAWMPRRSVSRSRSGDRHHHADRQADVQHAWGYRPVRA